MATNVRLRQSLAIAINKRCSSTTAVPPGRIYLRSHRVLLGVTSIPRRSSSLVGTPPCSCCWSCPLTRRTDQRYRTVRRRRRSTVQPHTATATRTGRWLPRPRSTRSGCCCTATHRRGSTSLEMHIETASSRPCPSGSSSLATTAGRKGACHQRSYFDRMTSRLLQPTTRVATADVPATQGSVQLVARRYDE